MTDTLLTELVEGYNVDVVARMFSQLYPKSYAHNKEKVLNAYRSITELADIEECDLLLCISMEEESSEEWENVYGFNDEDPDERYALGYMRWSKWLGASVSEETLNDYPSLEIVTRCLHEMTTNGFNEEEIGKAAERSGEGEEKEKVFNIFGYFRDEEERSGIEVMRRLLRNEIESSSED